AGSASTTPSATRPASASDRGPRTPARTGGTRAGGWSSCTSCSRTWRPRIVTRSPASRRLTAVTTSSSVVSGEGVRAPICAIHRCTPWADGRQDPTGAEAVERGDLHGRDRRVAGDGGEDAEPHPQPLGHRQGRRGQADAGGEEAVLDDPQLVGAAAVEAAGDVEDEGGRERAVEAHPDLGAGDVHPRHA